MITVPAPVRPVLPPVRPSAKAGPVGPGAGPLLTEYLLPSVLGTDDQKRMAKALRLGIAVKWIRSAERIIASKIAGCAWHLEDPDGKTIDDEWTGPDLALVQVARDLVDDPQGALPLTGPGAVGLRLSRRQVLTVASRQMGLAGNHGWYLDMLDDNGLPHALLPIRPDRLCPDTDKQGVLLEWLLDKRPGYAGERIPIERLRLLQLEPPDVGVFGPGLIESAMTTAANDGLIDAHWSSLLRSGGRISGILAPKQDAITDDGVYQQLERDWRNIVEQPDAARRLQIVRAPIEFVSTVQDASDLELIKLMDQERDALLALWGVPLTLLNGQHSGSTGLNGGNSRAFDEAALWQSAVHDRLTEIRETLQSILDLWEPVMGWAPRLCFEEPEFDDETPAYERAQKAEGQPLRNWERRAILGLDPFGDPALDNMVMMPVQVVSIAMAPDEDGNIPTPSMGVRLVDNPDPVAQAPGGNAMDTPASEQQAAPVAAKAAILPIGARRLRDTLDERVTPRLRAAVAAVLGAQRDAIAGAVEGNWPAISTHAGRDESQWWRDGAIDRALKPTVAGVTEQVRGYIGGALRPAKAVAADDMATSSAVDRAIARLPIRVAMIDGYTRDAIRGLIAEAISEGLSARDAADRIREWSGWDEARAERIARTELMNAYNSAALDTYGEFGVRQVVADDGDKDEQCAARHGNVYSVDDASAIADHPNGTLDWLPVAEGYSAEQVRGELHAVRPIRGME